MKTVIFDFDGTLADSLDVITEIFEQLTGQRIHELTKRETAELRHMPLLKVAERLHVSRWRVPFLMFHGRQLFARRLSQVKPFMGIQSSLSELHAKGYMLLVVSSNSTQNVRKFLHANGLDSYFTHVYGGIGLFSKSAALRKILQRNRLALGDCLYVGDESRDVEACNAIGLRCIAVEWGFADPKFLAQHKPFALVKTPAALVAAIRNS